MTRYDRLMNTGPGKIFQELSPKDVILYALGCGASADELDLIYEKGLVALPSMATVLAYPGNWYARPEVDIDERYIVHASERIELSGPLPLHGTLWAEPVITAIHDKGAGRGAIVVSRRDIRDGTGKTIASVTQRAFCRADGGLDGPQIALQPAATIPTRPADVTLPLTTSRRAAAIYRLSGDDNPLHIEPGFARAAGFNAPILHGLSTYGHICRLLSRHFPDRAIRMMDCRFTAPVYPGDTLDLAVWQTAEGLKFRLTQGAAGDLPGRIVIDNGEVEFFR